MLRTANKAAFLLLLILATQLTVGSSLPSGLADSSEHKVDSHDETVEGPGLEDFDDEFQSYLVETEPIPLKGSRVLRNRARHHRHGEHLHGSRDLASKGAARSYSRSFLDPDTEPRPFINCVPVPPSLLPPSKENSGRAKGKGNRRNSMKRSGSSTANRRNLKGSGKGNVGVVTRSRGRGMGRTKLPYCPFPTEEPTWSPTVTPIPTSTPLPTITPFPSFTPFPTTEETATTFAPTKKPTAAPSVSSRPSLRPSISEQPSKSSEPSAKVTTPPTKSMTNGPTTRNTSGRLGYKFFSTTTIREPTSAELNGLIVKTEEFYSAVLSAAYPGRFESFTMSNEAVTYTPTYSLPVIIDWDAAVVFKTNDSSTPTADQVFSAIEKADYQSYIMNYVWGATPVGTSLFFDTQRVAFAAKGGTVV